MTRELTYIIEILRNIMPGKYKFCGVSNTHLKKVEEILGDFFKEKNIQLILNKWEERVVLDGKHLLGTEECHHATRLLEYNGYSLIVDKGTSFISYKKGNFKIEEEIYKSSPVDFRNTNGFHEIPKCTTKRKITVMGS